MAQTVYEIPTSPTPQNFTTVLVQTTYNMTLTWNTVSLCWLLDIADQNDVPIINGIPLVTGANLLDQYEYLGIGGALYAQTDGDVLAVPTYLNLGTAGHLYFIPD